MSQAYIWNIQPLFQTFSKLKLIDELKNAYKNKQIRQTLQNLSIQYPTYRSIRGDGNCFYRAVAFSILKQLDLNNFREIFPQFDELDLTICQIQYIPKQFVNIYNTKTLNRIFKQGWEKYILTGSYQNQHEKQILLMNVFNKYFIMDFILILYFRSLNYKTLKQKKDIYIKYTVHQTSIEKQIKQIATFGHQSQGIQLYSMAQSLRAQILILMVTNNGINPLNISCMQKPIKKIILLFKPGHYDVIYSKNIQVISKNLMYDKNRNKQDKRKVQNIKEDNNIKSLEEVKQQSKGWKMDKRGRNGFQVDNVRQDLDRNENDEEKGKRSGGLKREGNLVNKKQRQVQLKSQKEYSNKICRSRWVMGIFLLFFVLYEFVNGEQKVGLWTWRKVYIQNKRK